MNKIEPRWRFAENMSLNLSEINFGRIGSDVKLFWTAAQGSCLDKEVEWFREAVDRFVAVERLVLMLRTD